MLSTPMSIERIWPFSLQNSSRIGLRPREVSSEPISLTSCFSMSSETIAEMVALVSPSFAAIAALEIGPSLRTASRTRWELISLISSLLPVTMDQPSLTRICEYIFKDTTLCLISKQIKRDSGLIYLSVFLGYL